MERDFQFHGRLSGVFRHIQTNLRHIPDVGADFQTKKDCAHDSTFQFTRDLEKYSEWTSKQIQARAKKLANAAVKIWTLPEEYQRNNVNVESIFNLDSDFELFTGKKLAIISVFNVEKSVSTWRDFQEEFVKQLYALDSETFKMAAKKFDDSRKRKLFSTDSADLNAALKIDDNLEKNTKKCWMLLKKMIMTLIQNTLMSQDKMH